METFKPEVETILFQLKFSPWASVAGVAAVLSEYEHFLGAAKTPTQNRRVSLQIFHASRAIDSFLAALVRYEGNKIGIPLAAYYTLKMSARFIKRYGVGGQQFTTPVEQDIRDLTDQRNLYLHAAANFPTDQQVRTFLAHTTRTIAEAITFPV